jgi:ABC-type uncharacterized transport system YnjBCD permease subunit
MAPLIEMLAADALALIRSISVLALSKAQVTGSFSSIIWLEMSLSLPNMQLRLQYPITPASAMRRPT